MLFTRFNKSIFGSAKAFLSLAIFLLFTACSNTAQDKTETAPSLRLSEDFKSYWYDGKAELNSYELSQVRYGEKRNGEAILIFVTEDFLIKKQVKKESNTNAKSASVLKLNFVRKFPTGIYDYSMMTSTFTSLERHHYLKPIKSTTSSQEWCGHSWMQLNRMDNAYQLRSYSYFESEGDLNESIDAVKLEDAIWNQIRINPESIEVGEVELFPSAHYLRFAHRDLKSYAAEITKGSYLKEDMPGGNLNYILINYPELDRSLQIIYTADAPYHIVGWKEQRASGRSKANMETVARRKASIKGPYWNLNAIKDSVYREKLQLR